MAIDLFILGLVALFGLLGGLTGAAKQIGQLMGLFAAYAVAGPLGQAFGPWMASTLGGVPLAMGTVAASMTAFVVVWVLLRWLVASILRRAMSGEDPEDRSVDRNLGMGLSAIKVAAAAYVLVCALVFAERNVNAFGKKLGVSPKDSIAFDIARRHNIFEMTQFAEVKDLIRVAQASSDPKQADKLKASPAFAALQKDPKWRNLASDAEVQKALQEGDAQSLLKSNAVMKLLQDGALMQQLEAVATAAER